MTTQMKASEVLQKMRAKIESGWTQRWFARTDTGFSCVGNDPKATSWCLVGALQSIVGRSEAPQISVYIDKLIGNPWCSWNDNSARTKDEVLAMLDKAIETAMKDEEILNEDE